MKVKNSEGNKKMCNLLGSLSRPKWKLDTDGKGKCDWSELENSIWLTRYYKPLFFFLSLLFVFNFYWWSGLLIVHSWDVHSHWFFFFFKSRTQLTCWILVPIEAFWTDHLLGVKIKDLFHLSQRLETQNVSLCKTSCIYL